MEIDMNKLDKAILYLQRIADGNNPVNNMPADDDAVLNNPNVIRCMFYVKDILEEIKRNGGKIVTSKAKANAKLPYPIEKLAEFAYEEDKTISKFAEQLNKDIDKEKYKTISYNTITKWLKAEDFLEVVQVEDRTASRPTRKGRDIGIYTEDRVNQRGQNYLSVLYDQNVQEYIVKNMSAIIEE